MAATDVSICNFGLTLLGEPRIVSLDDNTKQGRACKAVYEISRDALLAAHNWNFAKARAALPALTSVPISQFQAEYQLPTDCLRLWMLNDYYVGADLTDYRGSPTEEYSIEGRKILTNWGAPLQIRYIKRVTDPNQFDAAFVKAFGCQIALDLGEEITASETKISRAERRLAVELSAAVRTNAISLPPVKLADDEWLLSRL